MKKRRHIILLAIIGLVALGVAFLAGSGGKLMLPVEKKQRFEAASYENYPSMLRTAGSKIINEAGEEVVLTGLMAPDPQKVDAENNFTDEYYDGVFSFGGNVIRVPVHPDRYVTDAYYMWRYLDKLVGWAGEKGKYVIIDWHYIGNPKTGAGDEMPTIKEDPMELTKRFWEQTASYFKDTPNVIFEIYNEPAYIGWEAWKSTAEEMIKAIRDVGAGQPVLVGSPDYAYDISWIKSEPLADSNVIYAMHVFPNRMNWRSSLSAVTGKIPLVVTEWGYMDSDCVITQPYLTGSREFFGEPFVDFMAENKIGWVACWYDDGWEPNLFADATGRLTMWGEFIKDYAFGR